MRTRAGDDVHNPLRDRMLSCGFNLMYSSLFLYLINGGLKINAWFLLSTASTDASHLEFRYAVSLQLAFLLLILLWQCIRTRSGELTTTCLLFTVAVSLPLGIRSLGEQNDFRLKVLLVGSATLFLTYLISDTTLGRKNQGRYTKTFRILTVLVSSALILFLAWWCSDVFWSLDRWSVGAKRDSALESLVLGSCQVGFVVGASALGYHRPYFERAVPR